MQRPPSKLGLERPLWARIREVVTVYFPLAFVSFGGPAQVAVYLDLFVTRKKWLTQSVFAELFAVGQALPGPSNSLLVYCIALLREGLVPAIIGFLVWVLPGFVTLTTLGIVFGSKGSQLPVWLEATENGLVSAALGLLALAWFRLCNGLITSKPGIFLALVAFALGVNVSSPYSYPVIFVGCAAFMIGWEFLGAWLAASGMVRRFRLRHKGDGKESTARQDATEIERMATGAQRSGRALSTREPSVRADSVSLSRRTSLIGQDRAGLEDDGSDLQGNFAPSAASLNPGISPSLRNVNMDTLSVSAEPEGAEGDGRDVDAPKIPLTPRQGLVLITIWAATLIISAPLAVVHPPQVPDLFALLFLFWFTSCVSFGGVAVAVPILQSALDKGGYVSTKDFLVGVALTNAIPGATFNFTAYFGAFMMKSIPASILGAVVCWVAMFLPALLLITGILPLWSRLRQHPLSRPVFNGFNSAVVGLLLSTFYSLWQKGITPYPGLAGSGDAGCTTYGRSVADHSLYVTISAAAFTAVRFLGVPAPVAVVIGGAVGGIDGVIRASNRS